jgi:hypothetical protein
MKKSIFTLFVILMPIFSFSQRNEMKKNAVSVDVDKMTGAKTKQINLSTSDLKTMSESSIGLTLKDSTYTLYSYVYKSGWVFIESIMVKIDGKLFEFKSLKNLREVEPQAYISEKNWYIPTNDFIEAFKGAKEISYRLIGKDYYIDYDLKAKKLAIIPEFFN